LAATKDGRRNLVRAIDVMVWKGPNFFDAAPVLLRLAAAENESWANNATGEFGQLFRVYLSGTTVPALERLPVLRDGLASPEAAIRRVAIGALGSALQAGHFARMSDITLAGKRDANKDWRPATYDEFHGYWKECYLLLQGLVLAGGPEAELAKTTLAKHIDGILGCRLLLTLEPEFKALAAFVNGAWPEMKNAIRRTLDYSKDLVPEHRAALERWLDYVTPKGSAIEGRLRDIVSHPGYHHRKEADDSFTDLSQQDAEQLARELAQAGSDLTPHLAQLLTGEQQQGITFGMTLARQHPAAKQLLDGALAAWPTLKSDTRNESLIRGLFFGLENRVEKTRILERVANEAGLVDLLIPLTGVVSPMTETDFLRVRRAIEDERVPIERLRGLIPGMPLRTLPDEFIQREFVALARARPATSAMLFDVLALHCHNDRARLRFFTEAFQALLLMPNLPVLESHFAWQWHEIASALIAETNDADWLARVARYILDVLRTEETYIGTDYLRKVAIALLQKAPAATWPVFAAALADHESPQHYIFKEFLCGGGHGFEEEATDSPVAAVPLAQFEEWLKGHRELAPALLDDLPLYGTVKDAGGKLSYHWRPQALLLIDYAANEEEAMREILGNLWSFGSVGSRVPYWERRKALVAELGGMPNPKYQRIARELDAEIDRVIEQTKRQEMNEQARFN
jgi:hypothetical protein